jgi:hypothetical protein
MYKFKFFLGLTNGIKSKLQLTCNSCWCVKLKFVYVTYRNSVCISLFSAAPHARLCGFHGNVDVGSFFL